MRKGSLDPVPACAIVSSVRSNPETPLPPLLAFLWVIFGMVLSAGRESPMGFVRVFYCSKNKVREESLLGLHLPSLHG